MDTSILKDIIPAKHRKRVYALVTLVGALLAVTSVGLLAAGVVVPAWLVGITAAFNAFTALTGLTARANVDTPADESL